MAGAKKRTRRLDDNLLIQLHMREYIQEMQRQAELAKGIEPGLLQSVNDKNGFTAFSLMSQLLIHNTQAVRIAYKPPPSEGEEKRKKSKKEAFACLRRRWVRVALKVSEAEFKKLNEPFRNAFAHFDEKLDQYLVRQSQKRASIPPAEGVRVYASSPRFDAEFGRRANIYFEYVPNRDANFVICGATCSVKKSIQLSYELLKYAEAFLDGSELREVGWQWLHDVFMESKGQIDLAEALVFGK